MELTSEAILIRSRWAANHGELIRRLRALQQRRAHAIVERVAENLSGGFAHGALRPHARQAASRTDRSKGAQRSIAQHRNPAQCKNVGASGIHLDAAGGDRLVASGSRHFNDALIAATSRTR